MNQHNIISDTLAQDFTTYMQRYPELYTDFASFILECIPSRQQLCIVDLGSGPGLLMNELLFQLPKSMIIGIEPNNAMNKQAEKILTSVPPDRFSLLKEHAEAISVSSKSVDVVVSRFSAYAWTDPEKVIDEILRILKPGGFLVFELLNKRFPWWKRLLTKWGMYRKQASSKVIQFHIDAYTSAFTSEDFSALLKKKGFQQISSMGQKNEWKFRVLAYAPA